MSESLSNSEQEHSVSQQQYQNALKSVERLAYETENMSGQICKQLYNQSEKLQGIHDRTQQIDKISSKNKKLSRQLYSFWYFIKDKIAGDKNDKSVSPPSRKFDINVIREEPSENKPKRNQNTESVSTTTAEEKQQNEQQILDRLLQSTKTTKHNSKLISKQIDYQKELIDSINNKVDKINERNTYSNNLLRKKLGK